MKLCELREARAGKVQEMRSLADKADMSADDLARFDALKAEVLTLEQQEERAAFLQEAERRALGDKEADKVAGAVSILEAINAQVEGRALTGATAEYSAEVENVPASAVFLCHFLHLNLVLDRLPPLQSLSFLMTSEPICL